MEQIDISIFRYTHHQGFISQLDIIACPGKEYQKTTVHRIERGSGPTPEDALADLRKRIGGSWPEGLEETKTSEVR